jgi:hypothetical protein
MLIRGLRARPALSVLLAGAVAGLPGCGKEPPKLATVEGTVFVGGEPLNVGTAQRRGYVQLNPDAARGNTSLARPSGEIDSEGHFKIMTNVKMGVTPGWYKVAVSADFKPNPDNAYGFKELIPKRYFNENTSGLSFEVVENPAPGAYDLKLDKLDAK